ncbi:phosphopentomutase [Georgenia sp. Z1491]|uniref:phosphopentomutase n=1 Tax=Georgenia sp. Z1491 TaxID=3416707 RepID=UPI003CF8516F
MTVTILVVDGLGIGAMPDAGELRPGDVEADTIGHVAGWSLRERGRPLDVPHLAALGLAALRPDLGETVEAGTGDGPTGLPASLRAMAYRVALGYPGADTFAGHQTMMGADMSHVVLCPLADRIDAVAAALWSAGHRVERLDGQALLIVDGAALVHDNLEADPGLNWNVSCRLDDLPFEEIVAITRVVRGVAPVARVIAVGGRSDGPLEEFVRDGDFGVVGMDTPASGFYRNGGLEVLHLGAPIDHSSQLPQVAAAHAKQVTLIGKAADILECDLPVERRPGVDTADVLRWTLEAQGHADLVVANVQQTDLAGHQQDVGRYADLLEQVDRALVELTAGLSGEDLLVVTGDHGNDPTIGHGYHTREYVPALVVESRSGTDRGTERSAASAAADLGSLREVGELSAHRLGIDEPGSVRRA